VDLDDPKPLPIRPISVPEIRIEMMENLSRMAQLILSGRVPEYAANPDYHIKSLRWMFEEMASSTLWWVSPDMCDLLQSAFHSLPPTTLTEDLLPSVAGLVVFAKPLVGMDSRIEGHSIDLQAMQWGPCQFDVEEQKRIEGAVDAPVAGVSDASNEIKRALDQAVGGPYRFQGNGVSVAFWRKWEMWQPLGRTDWPYSFDTSGEFSPPDVTPHQKATIEEDRRILAAFLLLSQQEHLVSTTDTPPARAVQKRLDRKKIPTDLGLNHTVRLVNIHARHRPPTGLPHSVEWTKRWIVKGHWRQQAYGEGRQLRRPVYIAPFIKGPEGLPLDTTEKTTVRVWKN
jgi:hypothetical protein